MKREPVFSEQQVARGAVAELQRMGYDVYQEVSTGFSGRRPDIVGRRGRLVAVVECKTSLSLRLLDQLLQWVGSAHLVIGAVGNGRVGPAVTRFLRHEGIGLWYTTHEDSLSEQVAPRLYRQAASYAITRFLAPEQRTGQYAAAGSRGGGYWTPFQQTVRALEDLVTVKNEAGIPLRDALKVIDHHYASSRSAMSAIPALIQKGVISTLRVEGRPLRLYPAGKGGTR